MHGLIAFALAVQLGTAAPTELLLSVGETAPPFSMRDLDRKIFSLHKHVGEKPTEPRKALVLVFFATWCKPCMKEIPIIKKINRRWKKKGVEVVYLGLSQGAKDLAPFAKKNKFPWRTIPDRFGLLGRRYGAAQLPHLFVVGSDGKIVFQHRGIAPNLGKVLDMQLAKATGQKVPEDKEEPVLASKPRFDRSLRLGRVPSGKGSSARWEPLALYLGEAAKANIAVSTEASYAAFEKALKAGKYEIANAGPLLCHAVKEMYEPVVRIERQGTPTYLGILFATRASGLKRVTDLKGKTVGLVSERSTSGGLYPQKALLDAKLALGKDVKIKWLGSHTKVAEAVKAGTVDAGGCYEDCRDAVWASTQAKAIATKILGYTDEIPAEMILVKRSLDPGTKAAIRKAALKVNQSMLDQISQGELTVTGIFKAEEKDLDKVEAVLKKVRGAKGK